uniref:TOG domain-containing protein n=1 Tax=Entomoneis paludosa TaxID=265537 RepID=A0A7S2YIU4_9STRA|mmetsp:Transcript_3438/g.7141  ORF Transcript_3438/g.7141 Transcript_3438/m.7141 type:complete len:386 (+) Transcript_3438:195-1352(+)
MNIDTIIISTNHNNENSLNAHNREMEEYDLLVASQNRKRRASLEHNHHHKGSSGHPPKPMVSPKSPSRRKSLMMQQHQQESGSSNSSSFSRRRSSTGSSKKSLREVYLSNTSPSSSGSHRSLVLQQPQTPAEPQPLSPDVQECLQTLFATPTTADAVSTSMLQLGRALRKKKNLVWSLEQHATSLSEEGMSLTKRILHVMQVGHPTVARLQVAALCLLCRMIHANRWLASVQSRAGALRATLQAMRNFPHQSQVQMNACALLLKLLDDVLQNPDSDKVVRQELIPLAIQVIRQFSTGPLVSSSNPLPNAAKLLWRLSTTEAGRSAIVSQGGAEVVCRAMVASPPSSPTKQDLWALHLRLLQDHASTEQMEQAVVTMQQVTSPNFV